METAILMATYNGEKYINEQITSLINQSYTDWILYIRDDGSTDKTKEIEEKYSKLYPNKIKIVQKENSVSGSKYNFWELCKFVSNTDCKYIMFCDQDDVWNNDKIEKTINLMKQSETETPNIPVLVHTDLEVVDKDLNILNNSFIKYMSLNPKYKTIEKLLIQNNVTGCTMMINRLLLEKALLTSNIDNIIMHDWWIALIASVFGRIVFLDSATIKYRQHKDNVIGAKKTNSLKYIISRIFSKDTINDKLKSAIEQSKLFVNFYDNNLNGKTSALINTFSNIAKFNKIKRIYTIIKYGFWKQGIIRVIGEIVFM